MNEKRKKEIAGILSRCTLPVLFDLRDHVQAILLIVTDGKGLLALVQTEINKRR